ncbi:TPA: recombination-associated protein RdgC [Kluyvera intermedia]|nr:recombination-associated protein RdgC [Bifidobacterium longum]HAU8264464.1 recombination-associated protein RdgC [Kluyvera intermedia]
MNLPKFRNAIVYRATLPSIEAIEGHLAELQYEEIGETEFARAAFVPNPITGELVTPIENGYAIVVRRDEKIIPAQVVAKEARERIERIEKLSGGKLKRQERNAIICDVKVDLCKKAFVRSSLILALYNSKDNLLVVNTTNKNISSLVGSLLIKVVGSLKTETIHIDNIKNGLTTRLQNHLNGSNDAFDGFTVGDYIQLSRLVEHKEVLRFSAEHASITNELTESLAGGFTVDQMELNGCGVNFLLTERFHFRRIDTQSFNYSDDEDKAFQWRHQTGADLFQFSAVVNQLCKLLAYKEPEQQQPAA